MNVYKSFHDLPFDTLTAEAYAVLSKLVAKLTNKTDIIKVNNEEFNIVYEADVMAIVNQGE